MKLFYKFYNLFFGLHLLAVSASVIAMSPSIEQKKLLCDSIVAAANGGDLDDFLKQPDAIYAGRLFFNTHVKDSVFEISRSGSGWHSAYIRSINKSSAPGPEKYSDELSNEVLEDKESIAIYHIEANDVVVTNMNSTEMNAELYLLHSGELSRLCSIELMVANYDRKENSLKCRALQDRLRGAREFRVKGVERKSIDDGATCQSNVLYVNGEPLFPGAKCGVSESVKSSGAPYIYRIYKDGRIDIFLYRNKSLVCRLIPSIRYVKGN